MNEYQSAKFETIDTLAPLSYKTIKNTLYEFRRSGTRSSEFNTLDVPGQLYFKIIFHFFNGDAFGYGDGLESGLLSPTWEIDSHTNTTVDTRTANSAYNFLIRNDELERAEKLRQFITLLSNISSYSPWYFSEISGLDAVMERGIKTGEPFKIEEPKQISITCLPDSMDARIGTLLDLYRDVIYSQINHKEIVPANLRKFDMSIYIFESTIADFHTWKKDYAEMNENSKFPTSFKRIELHDCEFAYDTVKDGYSGMKNTDGFQSIYKILINVGAAYEHRYNEFIDRTIGDVIATDMFTTTYTPSGSLKNIYADQAQETRKDVLDALQERIEKYEHGNIDMFKIVDDITGNAITGVIDKVLLGNIYKTSLTDINNNLQRLAKNTINGNIGGIADNARALFTSRSSYYNNEGGTISPPNMYSGDDPSVQEANVGKEMGNIFTRSGWNQIK